MHCNARHRIVLLSRLLLAAGLLFSVFTTSRAAPPAPEGLPPAALRGAQMVKDINTQNAWSVPRSLTIVGSAVYFSADDGVHGNEIWRSEGTPQTTSLFLDFTPGPEPTYPYKLTRLDDTHLVFFTVDDQGAEQMWAISTGGSGLLELYRSAENKIAADPVNLNGVLYFSRANGLTYQLWKTNGTPSGTGPVTDLPLTMDPIEVFDGWVYFAANGPEGEELYRVNDSVTAPERVTDLCKQAEECGAGAGNSHPIHFAPASDRLYFVAYDAVHGAAIWSTTGTEASLTLAADVVPGVQLYSEYYTLQPVGSGLFYETFDGMAVQDLWYTPGIAASAHRVNSSEPGLVFQNRHLFTALGNTLFFSATTSALPTHSQLFRATESGIERLTAAPRNIALMVPLGSLLYFNGFTPSGEGELWKVAETGAPQRIARVGFLMSVLPPESAALNNRLYFTDVDEAHGMEIWTSDGSEAGTHLIMDINQHALAFGAGIDDLSVRYKDSIFFKAIKSNQESMGLWRTDGTTPGTIQLTANGTTDILDAGVFNDLLYFIAQDSQGYSGALYRTDGTKAGTAPVPGISGARYVFGGDQLFFTGRKEGSDTLSLWAMNKQDAQPRIVRDLGDVSSFQMGVLGTTCLMMRWSEGGWEFWRSDGTAAGTVRFYGPVATGVKFFYNFPEKRPALGGRMFFVAPALDNSGVWALYVTDGVTVHQITAAQGIPAFPTEPVLVGETVYFGGMNGDDLVLWKLPKGSTQAEVVHTSGAQMSEVFYSSQLPTPLANLNGKVVFRSTRPGENSKLWISDGTLQGTRPLCPDCGYTIDTFAEPVVSNGVLYFAARDSQHGNELWASDGTDAGTGLFLDVRPGPESAEPDELAVLGDRLLFTATDGTDPATGHGRELWRYDLRLKTFLPMLRR